MSLGYKGHVYLLKIDMHKDIQLSMDEKASECVKLLHDHQRNTVAVILLFKMRPEIF